MSATAWRRCSASRSTPLPTRKFAPLLAVLVRSQLDGPHGAVPIWYLPRPLAPWTPAMKV